MYSDNLVIKLNGLAHQYKDIVHRAIHDVLNQIKNTGAGAASLTVDVVDGNNNKAPEIMISFDDHLVFLDKRKMQWTKLSDIKKLMEWATTVKPSEREAKQLAWATAWKQKKTDAWRPKPWRRKSLSKVLKEMNALVKEVFDKAIEEDFQAAADATTPS
jgi:hypothetical protein